MYCTLLSETRLKVKNLLLSKDDIGFKVVTSNVLKTLPSENEVLKKGTLKIFMDKYWTNNRDIVASIIEPEKK